jgi:hypothetical protein
MPPSAAIPLKRRIGLKRYILTALFSALGVFALYAYHVLSAVRPIKTKRLRLLDSTTTARKTGRGGYAVSPASSSSSWSSLPIESLDGEGMEGLRSPAWIQRRDPGIVEEKDHLVMLWDALGGTPEAFDAEMAGRRVVLIDWGAADFGSSVKWLLEKFQYRFKEVHAWEIRPDFFTKTTSTEDLTKLEQHGVALHKYEGRALKAKPAPGSNDADAVAWLLSPELALKKDDFVFLKIDIENEEWAIFPLMEAQGVWELIDELAIEIHYNEPDLERHGWTWKFGKEHGRADVKAFLRDLRIKGVRAHYWP